MPIAAREGVDMHGAARTAASSPVEWDPRVHSDFSGVPAHLAHSPLDYPGLPAALLPHRRSSSTARGPAGPTSQPLPRLLYPPISAYQSLSAHPLTTAARSRSA